MKIIALERGLEELKPALEARGYKAVFADEIEGSISAYIYQGQNLLGQQSFHSALNNFLLTDSAERNTGVLLIQAANKTVDQIISIIENRTYSPLF
ncbi:MAG: YkuS family protein [Caldicoprobacterales bacterium]